MNARLVDYENSQQDLTAVLMAECGFYARTIAAKCGLSVGQVSYRYRKVGVRLRDYREGKNWMSRVMIDAVLGDSKNIEQMKSIIRKRLKERK